MPVHARGCEVVSSPQCAMAWGDTQSNAALLAGGFQADITLLKLRFYGHSSFHSQRWFYFAALLLVDTAQHFYALEEI